MGHNGGAPADYEMSWRNKPAVDNMPLGPDPSYVKFLTLETDAAFRGTRHLRLNKKLHSAGQKMYCGKF